MRNKPKYCRWSVGKSQWQWTILAANGERIIASGIAQSRKAADEAALAAAPGAIRLTPANFAALAILLPKPSPELALLGLPANATREEIKAAYYRLAKQHHPDRFGDAETFKRITAAYEKAIAHTPEAEHILF
jgi:hypothetical protein